MGIFFLDGITIIIFLIFIFSGFKKGVARSLLSFVGAVFSLVFSMYISSIASGFIYDYFIEKKMSESISKAVSDKSTESKDILSAMPNFIKNSLKIYDITGEKISIAMKNNGIDKQKILSDLFSPAIKGVIRDVLSILLFSIFMVIIGGICRNISYVFQAPILRQIDGLLGGLFGAFKGYLVIVVLIVFLKMFLPAAKMSPEILSDKNVDSTILFSHMYKNNLIYGLYRSVNTFIGVGI